MICCACRILIVLASLHYTLHEIFVADPVDIKRNRELSTQAVVLQIVAISQLAGVWIKQLFVVTFCQV